MQNLKKLHWKCRRGMKEMDILFEHYLYEHYESADDDHQLAFEAMCEMPDPKITDYLFERSQPEQAAVADVIDMMRDYNAKRLKG